MYLLAVASGMDPRKIGFNKNMLDRKYKNLFNIFNGKSSFAYTETKLFRDEQIFTFYLAAKRRVKATLVEDFKKTNMYKEAKDREEELFKIFCSIYESVSIPKEIEPKVLSIYKEELNLFEI